MKGEVKESGKIGLEPRPTPFVYIDECIAFINEWGRGWGMGWRRRGDVRVVNDGGGGMREERISQRIKKKTDLDEIREDERKSTEGVNDLVKCIWAWKKGDLSVNVPEKRIMCGEREEWKELNAMS